MDDQDTTTPDERRDGALARWGRPGAFAAAGLVAGALLAGSLTASAADSGTTPTAPGYASGAVPGGDPSQPMRSDEELLTGTTGDKVEAAVLAKYPGATVVRLETDSDGVYEAHLVRADGTPITVELDKSFTITGTEEGGPGGRGGGPCDGDAPASGGSTEGTAYAA